MEMVDSCLGSVAQTQASHFHVVVYLTQFHHKPQISIQISFKDSNFSTYQKMWSTMESQKPSVFTSSNSEGVDRVQKAQGMYAFLMESSSIEYIIERNCDLQQVGGLLDSKGSENDKKAINQFICLVRLWDCDASGFAVPNINKRSCLEAPRRRAITCA
jgi:hypothetical protein